MKVLTLTAGVTINIDLNVNGRSNSGSTQLAYAMVCKQCLVAVPSSAQWPTSRGGATGLSYWHHPRTYHVEFDNFANAT